MQENPFEQSTLQTSQGAMTAPFSGSTPSTTGIGEGIGSNSVEVRYPPVQRTLVPAVLLFSAFLAPAIICFVIPPPLRFILAAVILLMEVSTAGLIWFILNSAFVRADETGITKAQFGQTKSVRWEEIGGLEMQESTLSRPPRMEYVLKDREGRALLQFSDFGDPENGERLKKYIAARLEQR